MVALYLEPVAGHACLVLGDEIGALLLGIVRCREQHAFVALCLLIGAYAARLFPLASYFLKRPYRRHTLYFVCGAVVSLRSAPILAAVGGATSY